MTTTTAPTTTGGSSLRRVWALARLELTMLVRNKTALFNAIALGPLMAFFVSTFTMPEGGEAAFVTMLLTALAVFALLLAGYYNLCTTSVARREELMFKRLVTGELTRAEVLTATAVPPFVIILAQVVLGSAAAMALIEVPPMTNPLLPVVGLVLGFIALAALGYATAIITRTVESAQVTTILPLGALMLLSGSTLPLSVMPDTVRTVAELTPLAAVNELFTMGLTGTTADGSVVDFGQSFLPALQPVVVLLAWTAIGAYLVSKKMPWEPRR